MKKLLILTCSALSLLIVSNSALAEDKEPHSFMKAAPVVVTATRFEASIDTAPVNITAITADDIAMSNATTLSDVLKTQAGISVSSLFGISGSNAKIDMGGFGDNSGSNTLVLLNGRRLNDIDLQGINLAIIPLDSIAQIEIVHGSSTVLYGDNAVSGVINIVTKNGYDSEHSSIKLQVGSFQTQRLSADIRTIVNNTALSLAFDRLISDGYRDNNDNDNFSLMGELSREDSTWTYGARINLSREHGGLPGALDEPTTKITPTSAASADRARQRRHSIEGFFESEHTKTEITVSKKHQDYVSIDYGLYTADTELSTLSLTPRANQTYGRHALVGGFDFYRSNFDASTVYIDPFSPIFNSNNTRDITQDSYGIYLNDAITITETTKLNLGFRHHIIEVEANDIGGSLNNKRKDSTNSWDITLNRKHSYGALNYVRIAKSFRSPVLDEMWNFTTGDFTLIKPQTALHYEIGTRQKFNNGMKLTANLFRMDVTDEIAFDGSANTNLDKTRHEGLNFNVSHAVSSQLSVNAGYTYRKANFVAGINKSKAIPLVPRDKISLSGSYKISANSQLGLDATHTSKRYFGDDNTNIGKQLPGYTQMNMSYSKQFNEWRAKILINNLTDVHTADAGYYVGWLTPPYSYYPLPERAIYITFEGDI